MQQISPWTRVNVGNMPNCQPWTRTKKLLIKCQKHIARQGFKTTLYWLSQHILTLSNGRSPVKWPVAGYYTEKVAEVKNVWYKLLLLSTHLQNKTTQTKKTRGSHPKPTIAGNHQLWWITSLPSFLVYTSPFLPLALGCRAVSYFWHDFPFQGWL